ncbi:MAG: sn-glycerol-3-phosphate ABC transporter ATP-binding protein UgpC [Planktomarina sp.]|nr:sn-glycerol-3-phosphate ABC transporter ATP-binding protein UgpC [Planktomarina sp.]
MAVVTLKDIVKVYNGELAVRGINLEIPDKSFTVLVGPSGCGKTTTLRMVAGLESISHGELRIDGKLANTLPSRDRGVSMVFQSYALYPHLTVRENLAFSLKLEKLPKVQVEDRVSRAAAVLEIEPYLNRRPSELSGGQRQRVAMGRAIVREPDVFLFDEPLSNLDAKLRNQMRVEIKRLQKRLQVTTLYVTHDQIEAMTLADIMVVMRDGRIEQIGTPMQIFETPINQFVAGFIGSPQMNFFEGQAAYNDGKLYFYSDELTLPIPQGRFKCAFAEGSSLVAGFRPEDIVPVGHGIQPDMSITINSPVEFVEMLGNETLLFSRLAGREFISRMQRPRELVPNEIIEFKLNMEQMQLFDAQSGRSLR